MRPPPPPRGSYRGPLPPKVRSVAHLGAWVLLAACSDDPTVPQEPVPTELVLSATSIAFEALDDTLQLTATVQDQYGESMPDFPVTWTSTAEDVATVSDEGLVRAVAVGEATVRAAAAGLEAQADVRVDQVPSHLRFEPDVIVLEDAGDTVRVRASVRDANENEVPALSVSWATSDPEVASIDADGLVTAVAEGVTTVIASAGEAETALSTFVGEQRLIVNALEPEILVEGEIATVRGLGFSQDAERDEVLLDGTPASVVFATSTELRVRVPDADCRPARTGLVRVTAFALSDSTEAEVRPRTLDALEVGEGVWSADQCLHLAAGSGTERYLVGILSGSEVSSSLTPASLRARTGEAELLAQLWPTPPDAAGRTATRFEAPRGDPLLAERDGAGVRLTSPAGPIDPQRLRAAVARRRRAAAAEDRVRAADLRLLRTLGPLRGGAGGTLARETPGPGGPLAAVPEVDDVIAMKVPRFDGDACSSYDSVDAVVRHVGDAAVFLEDEGNPTGGLTTAQYAALDDTLASATLPVVETYFGELGDRDENEGRILVLVTKEVNKRENLRGFVFSGDLRPATQCASSNEAEIFYGIAPDPSGTHGDARPTAEVFASYPTLIAHELTHIAQFSNARGPKTRWELEGGATLAEQLVGFEIYGHEPRQNLGVEDWLPGFDAGWYFDWVIDLAVYYGFQGMGEPKALAAPEECSWAVVAEEANDGPCLNDRAAYGVPATFLRYVLDRRGPSFGAGAAGDAELMRRLVASSSSGFGALASVLGEDPTGLRVEFAVALWADDRAGDWLLSWNAREIFAWLADRDANTQLEPHASSDPTPTLDVDVRASSNAYLEWSPPALHAPTSLRIRTAGGDPLPEHMLLWILRIQ